MTDADKTRFAQAFARLAIALREKDPDAIVLRVYFDGLRDLEIEFVVAAADRMMQTAWFPKVSDWRQEAQRVERERAEEQRAHLRRLPQPLCEACGDTGWAMTATGVTRCPCAAQRRLELLGRAPTPQPELIGEMEES